VKEGVKKNRDDLTKLNDQLARQRRYRRREALETTLYQGESFLKAVWDEVNGREPEPDPIVERYKSVRLAIILPRQT
jgi:hypothetical protein